MSVIYTILVEIVIFDSYEGLTLSYWNFIWIWLIIRCQFWLVSFI